MLSTLPILYRTSSRTWLVAYGAFLLIPLALIVQRGVADALMTLIGILFLWHSAQQKNWQWLKDPLTRIGLLAWIWIVFVVSPLASLPGDSLMMGLPWIRFLLFFTAVTYWVLTRKEDWYPLAWMLIILMTAVSIDTLWQYVTGVSLSGNLIDRSGRLTGPMSNVKVGIFMAKLLIPTIGICLYLSAQTGRRILLWLLAAMLLFFITTILLSGERTAFICTVVATTIISVSMVVIAPKTLRIYLLSLFLFTFVIALVFATQSFVQYRFLKLLEILENFWASPYGQLFHGGYLIGKEHWLTGAGLRGFRHLCPDLITSGQIMYCNIHPHNPYIEWFSETGLPGFLLFVAMVALLFYRAIRAFRRSAGLENFLALAIFGTFIIHFFPFMPTQSIFSNWPAILLWYSLSIAFSWLNLIEPASRKTFSS